MTSQELNQFIMDNTQALINSNAEQIASLISAIDFSQDISAISASLACVIATASVSIATGLTLRLLDGCGVIDLENTSCASLKPKFTVIPGGLSSPKEQK